MADIDRADLVCLYLDTCPTRDEDEEASPARTATGIGNALEVDDVAARRVGLLADLADLVDQGFISRNVSPVDGFDVPRPVYTLTPAGRERAVRLREQAREQTVTVETDMEMEVTVADIDRYIESETPLVTALARCTADGTVPLESSGKDSFVGRQAELESLQTEIEESFVRESRTIVVSGTSGVGKSALVREATDQVRETEDAIVATGASMADATEPYGAFRRAFEAIPDGSALRSQLDEAKMGEIPDDPAAIQTRRAALFGDVASELRAVASQPIIIVLENLQWADVATLSLFEYLATEVDEWIYPIVFVGTYRESPVTATDEHPLADVLDGIEAATTYTEFQLEPLTRIDTSRLLEVLIDETQLPPKFVDLVYERTGGNPLFIQETVATLRETGAVEPAAGQFPTDPAAIGLPETVTAHIDRRLDALDEESRDLLAVGAVIGEQIPGRVLAAATVLSAPARREYTDTLIASGIWRPVDMDAIQDSADAIAGTNLADTDLQFVSGGFREAVIDRLAPEQARLFHERVANAYLAVTDEDPGALAGRVAHHFEEAGETAKARTYYHSAGDHALETYAHDDAIEQYSRALDLARAAANVDEAVLGQVFADLAAVLSKTGEYEDAMDAIEDGLDHVARKSETACELMATKANIQHQRGEFTDGRETAERLHDVATDIDVADFVAEALALHATTALSQDEYDRAREHFDKALVRSREQDDTKREARIMNRLGLISIRQGKLDRAHQYHEQSLEIAREHGHKEQVAASLAQLGFVSQKMDEYEAARERFQEAGSIRRELGDKHGAAKSNINLGVIAQYQGDYERARNRFEDGLEMLQTVGDSYNEAKTLTNLGQIALRLGDYDRARQYHERSLEIKRELGDQSGEAVTLNNLGLVAKHRGAYERAQELVTESRDIFEELGDDRRRAEAVVNLGSIFLCVGADEKARTQLTNALETATATAHQRCEADARYRLARLARRDGRFETADSQLTQARSIHSDLGNQFELAKNVVEAARLALERDDLDTASDEIQQAVARFETVGATHWLGRCQLVYGWIAEAAGDHDSARDHRDEALEAFEQVGAPQDSLLAVKHLVRSLQQEADETAVRGYVDNATDRIEKVPDAVANQHREWIASVTRNQTEEDG